MATIQPLNMGSRGRAVAFLQSRLGVAADGIFGVHTDAALRAWQTPHLGYSNGVYDAGSNRAMTRRTPADILHTAQVLAADPKALQAVLSVETSGAGFYDNGLPKILLERHYVYRLATDAQRAALTQDVCSPTPGGYAGGLAEWDRFEKVATIDVDLATRSCSWGLPQIMGDNFAAAGALTVSQFRIAMALDEARQLDAMGAFIKSNPAMLTALQTKDWAGFARRYNGPNYSINKYDVKLAGAYDAS